MHLSNIAGPWVSFFFILLKPTSAVMQGIKESWDDFKFRALTLFLSRNLASTIQSLCKTKKRVGKRKMLLN